MADEFSDLLGQLKERSGLSYGVLGKRLHMSASTLHRYVNGDAVPTDYAPVERLARLCKATPAELVELHRQWVLADARRGQKTSPTPTEAPSEARPVTETGPTGTAGTAGPAPPAEPETVSWEKVTVPGPGDEPWSPADVESGTRPETPANRRRTVVLAGIAVAAALVSAALVVNLVPGKGNDDKKESLGATVSSSASADPTTGPSPSSDAKKGSPSPSATPDTSPSPTATGAAAESGDGATAPTVAVNPYKWDGPCSQHYLVDDKPEQVPPPPSEQDARGWVTALGGVAAGEQMLALTVQGTGKATVVLEAMHVQVVSKDAPLAWNDFAMGVGCGGGVETASFRTNLDDGRPSLSPKGGRRDFPYKVSESDPEVFYVFADTSAHDVSWYLELDWSSGDQHGTVRIDNKGTPFRTSGNVGRPAYNYPIGSSEWGRDEYEPNIPG
ncbi:helix-turn-helix domain-containing protein [Streptomyces sp. NPDC047072]|uniref:helix-turn-helix domain-containing protein n=1 Tax=Streptomyces sp. NPDC047072 TaxID=3154809 RepID=UPI0033C0E537